MCACVPYWFEAGALSSLKVDFSARFFLNLHHVFPYFELSVLCECVCVSYCFEPEALSSLKVDFSAHGCLNLHRMSSCFVSIWRHVRAILISIWRDIYQYGADIKMNAYVVPYWFEPLSILEVGFLTLWMFKFA